MFRPSASCRGDRRLFDFLAFFISLDNPASSTLTQELLDWHPTHPGIVDDLNEGHYFQS